MKRFIHTKWAKREVSGLGTQIRTSGKEWKDMAYPVKVGITGYILYSQGSELQRIPIPSAERKEKQASLIARWQKLEIESNDMILHKN